MQQTYSLPDDSCQVAIPYADDPALIRDILRHGSDVQLIAPQQLRTRVQASRYSDSGQ